MCAIAWLIEAQAREIPFKWAFSSGTALRVYCNNPNMILLVRVLWPKYEVFQAHLDLSQTVKLQIDFWNLQFLYFKHGNESSCWLSSVLDE